MRTLLVALLLAAGCAQTATQHVEDAAAGHRLACELAKTQQLTPEEQKAVDAACAVRCEPTEP
jgi:hypothetical protein